MEDDEDEEVAPPPPVIFINRVDTYFGTILAQHLSQCKPLATTNDDPSIKLRDFEFLTAERHADNFQIIGSYRTPDVKPDPLIPSSVPQPPKVPGVTKLLPVETLNLEGIKESDLIIFHSCDDDDENQLFSDTERIFELTRKLLETDKRKRRLVLVSNLMTWCNTKRNKPPHTEKADETAEEEEEEPEVFTEDDFRKRRPHPDYKAHLEFEKTFLKLEKEMKKIVKTAVVAAGVIYGFGEGILHALFKEAWYNIPSLPVFGELKGKNQIPMVHVRDLVQIVQNVCDTKPEVRYIIAVTGSQTQKELVECISKALTTRQIDHVPPEDTDKQLENRTAVKVLSADFPHFAGKYVTQGMKVKWTAEEGFSKAINKVVNEYKIIRNLLPIKVNIVGPPFSGKTTLAKKTAQFYKLHHIVVDEVVSAALDKLTLKANPPLKGENTPPSEQLGNEDGFEIAPPEVGTQQADVNEEELEEVKATKQLLTDIETEKEANNGALPDRFIVQFLREKLLTKPCQNQGWVLEGFPKTYANAKELFGLSEESEETHEEEPDELDEEEPKEGSENEEVIPVDKRVFPDYIFYLDVDKDLLQKRFMDRPEDFDKAATTEEEFNAAFAKYTSDNPEEQNVLSFFDEAENHAQWVDLSKDKSAEMLESNMTLISKIGHPHNYEPTSKEKADRVLEKEAAFLQRDAGNVVEDDSFADQPPSVQNVDQPQWNSKVEVLRIEEYAKRELKAMPPLAYLVKYVFPSLQEALQQTARVKPDNPVDHFAELLISSTQPRNNFETSASRNKKLSLSKEQGSGDVAKPPNEAENIVEVVETPTEGTNKERERTSISSVEDVFFVGGTAHMIPRRSTIMDPPEARPSEVGLTSGRAHRFSDFDLQPPQ